jgi:excisionase family DNA binding protein
MSQTRWWTLPEAAAELQIHRATVNAMVLDGRLKAERHGSQWVVEDSVFKKFKDGYERPHHSTRRHQSGRAADAWITEILDLLVQWDEGTATELAEVLELHVGNVRKYLALSETRNLAQRNDYGMWRATEAGRAQMERWRPQEDSNLDRPASAAGKSAALS